MKKYKIIDKLYVNIYDSKERESVGYLFLKSDNVIIEGEGNNLYITIDGKRLLTDDLLSFHVQNKFIEEIKE